MLGTSDEVLISLVGWKGFWVRLVRWVWLGLKGVRSCGVGKVGWVRKVWVGEVGSCRWGRLGWCRMVWGFLVGLG